MCLPPPPSSTGSCITPKSSPSPARATASETGRLRKPRPPRPNQLARTQRNEVYETNAHWPVLIRPALAGYQATNDTVLSNDYWGVPAGEQIVNGGPSIFVH